MILLPRWECFESYLLTQLSAKKSCIITIKSAQLSFTAQEVALMGRNPYGDDCAHKGYQIASQTLACLDASHMKIGYYPPFRRQQQRVQLPSGILAQL